VRGECKHLLGRCPRCQLLGRWLHSQLVQLLADGLDRRLDAG
jgi:hypothetical protein